MIMLGPENTYVTFLAFFFVIKHCCNGFPMLPPHMTVKPRHWNIPIDYPVGRSIAKVTIFDSEYSRNSSANLTIKLVPLLDFDSPDMTQFFYLDNIRNGVRVKLAKPLVGILKPGGKYDISVVGHSSESSIDSRVEVSINIEDPEEDLDSMPDRLPGTSSSHDIFAKTTTKTTIKTTSSLTSQNFLSTVETSAHPTEYNPKTKPKNEKSSNNNETNIDMQATNLYVRILVPILVLCPALLIALCLFRRRIKNAFYESRDMKWWCCKETSQQEIVRGKSQLSASLPYAQELRYHEQTNLRETHQKSFSDGRWEFPRHRLQILHMIGEGCFGQVWKALIEEEDPGSMNLPLEYKGNSSVHVAIKTLKENATEKERLDLIHELGVMKMLDQHPNVVKLIGCCTEKDPVFVIMEYISGGTLQDFLRKSRSEQHYNNLHGKSQSLNSKDLTSFAYQVAKGMEYLSSKKVIHRDLAARNILIEDASRICKVADFGFARDVMANNIYERKSEGRLPIRWMAPESLYDNCYTTKSDVWSFGVLVWEIVTLGSTPYPGLGASEVLKRVKEGYRLEMPPHCTRELYNIMFYCWDIIPENRPTFTELINKYFEVLLLQDTDYIDLNMFPEHAYYNQIDLSGEKV